MSFLQHLDDIVVSGLLPMPGTQTGQVKQGKESLSQPQSACAQMRGFLAALRDRGSERAPLKTRIQVLASEESGFSSQ